MTKQRNQPKLPPPTIGLVSLGRSEPFFDAADISRLTKAAGLPLASGVDPSHAAARLCETYDYVRYHGAHPEGYPAPPSVRRAHYMGVLKAAKKLWNQLGIPGDIASYQSAGVIIREAEQWFGSLTDPFTAIDKYPWEMKESDWLERTAMVHDVMLAPDVIGRIASLAEANLRLLRNTPRAWGRHEDLFKKILYFGLAGEYSFTFGHRPETGRERDQPNCASSIWVDNLTNLAAERIATRILLNVDDAVDRAERVKRHPLVIAATEVAQQAFVTKADALAEGWKEFTEKSGNSSKPKKPRTHRVSTPRST